MRDLGLDSLATTGLIVEIEDEFELEIPDDRLGLENFKTPESLWLLLNELIVEHGPDGEQMRAPRPIAED